MAVDNLIFNKEGFTIPIWRDDIKCENTSMFPFNKNILLSKFSWEMYVLK